MNIDGMNRVHRAYKFPCDSDFKFFMAMKVRQIPNWAREFAEKSSLSEPNIDRCVNTHAGIRLEKNEMEASNLCSLIRLHESNLTRRNLSQEKIEEGVKHFLVALSTDPSSRMRRRRYALKWAKRI